MMVGMNDKLVAGERIFPGLFVYINAQGQVVRAPDEQQFPDFKPAIDDLTASAIKEFIQQTEQIYDEYAKLQTAIAERDRKVDELMKLTEYMEGKPVDDGAHE